MKKPFMARVCDRLGFLWNSRWLELETKVALQVWLQDGLPKSTPPVLVGMVGSQMLVYLGGSEPNWMVPVIAYSSIQALILLMGWTVLRHWPPPWFVKMKNEVNRGK